MSEPRAWDNPFRIVRPPALDWRGPPPPLPQSVAPKRKAEENGRQDDRAEAGRPAKGARATELKVPEAKAGWKQEDAKKVDAALTAWEIYTVG